MGTRVRVRPIPWSSPDAYPSGGNPSLSYRWAKWHSRLMAPIESRTPDWRMGFGLKRERTGLRYGNPVIERTATSGAQEEEFEYLLRSLSVRIAGGVEPKEILVLVPRKKLGQEFVAYANARRNQAGLSAAVNFVFSGKPEFTETEQERILLFGLAVKPSSLLHERAFIGLGDANWRAKGRAALKRRYGNLFEAPKSGKESDFSKGQKSARMAGKRVEELREAVQSVTGHSEVTPLLEKLFPSGNPETAELRKILDELSEEDDTPASLYAKFIDYIRTVP